MEKFTVLPNVQAFYRLSRYGCEFVTKRLGVDKMDHLAREQEIYLLKRELERGERLLMFLPARMFMAFTLDLTEKDFIPNRVDRTMREGFLGEIKLPVLTYVCTDAMLLPQRYFLMNPCFAKINEADLAAFVNT